MLNAGGCVPASPRQRVLHPLVVCAVSSNLARRRRVFGSEFEYSCILTNNPKSTVLKGLSIWRAPAGLQDSHVKQVAFECILQGPLK